MRLAIVHYHLRKGGVTKVIATALEALAGKVEKVVVLSSTEPEEPLPCPVALIPGLAYTTEASRKEAAELHTSMVDAAREHLGDDPDLWHIHNHSLGKNARFPGVVRRLAEEGARLLLQIHDFAEDGRPANYAAQRAAFDRGTFDNFNAALYPVAPQIGYAVLNGRDFGILGRAGIPRDRLFWLPNAVTVPSRHEEADQKEPQGTPLILYPTRGIRRKNLGELLLLAAVCPEFHYATSLTPKNPDWIPIHDNWAAIGRELDLPVTFGLGEEAGQAFEDLVKRSRAMITTSVGEGFGLAFLEPWLFGKPVAGRDLPEVTDDFRDNGIRLPDLYSEWRIPGSLFDMRGLKARFREAVGAMYAAYGMDLPRAKLEGAWARMTADNAIDCARMDETAQAEALRSVTAGNRSSSPQPPVDLAAVDETPIAANTEKIRDMYGISRYGKTLTSIYSRLLEAGPQPPAAADANAILTAFLEPERLRLLRT